MSAPLVLPQDCPVCGAWLQQALDPAEGVRPHFKYCHPNYPVPVVA